MMIWRAAGGAEPPAGYQAPALTRAEVVAVPSISWEQGPTLDWQYETPMGGAEEGEGQTMAISYDD